MPEILFSMTTSNCLWDNCKNLGSIALLLTRAILVGGGGGGGGCEGVVLRETATTRVAGLHVLSGGYTKRNSWRGYYG